MNNMFEEGQKVKILGAFLVAGRTEEYSMVDPFEKGYPESTEKYLADGTTKLNRESHKNDLDSGNFLKFDGEYEVVRSNEIFTKLKVGDRLVSVPNNKLEEVE